MSFSSSPMKPSLLIPILVFVVGIHAAPDFTADKILQYREKARSMFYHAYDGYMQYAYPYDELRPITCDGHNTWGSYSLSLIDSLSTLIVLGNQSEFRKAADLVMTYTDFDIDINVSVFETNIRVVGGLLSAHLLSHRTGGTLPPGWPCQGPLLDMAVTIAEKLLPAFDSETGMPYGTVNLKYGVPHGETQITCTACVGTYIVEFGTLSRLTGNSTFEAVARKALDALWQRRSEIGLVGNHINVGTGAWTALDSGIGAAVDSYFEYLLKGSMLLHDDTYFTQLKEYISAFETHLKRNDWYVWVNMKNGRVTLPVFQSLEAFWPGIQALMGDLNKSKRTLLNYFQVWEQFGATPEYYDISKLSPNAGREGYPLRPELIESTMYLYQATGDPYLLHIGATILDSIEALHKTRCGYAVMHDVTSHKLANRMESFFLAETVKYLYLLFDPENFIHGRSSEGTIINTENGRCIIDSGGYVFNTEAHPIDSAALDCCHSPPERVLRDVMGDINIQTVLDIDKGTSTNLFYSDSDSDRVDNKRYNKLSCTVDVYYSKVFSYGHIMSLIY